MDIRLARVGLGLGLILALGNPGEAQEEGLIQNDVASPAADIKLDHRVGAGIGFAGPMGLLGLLVDVNLNPFLSLSGFAGTGYEYMAFGGKINYYILGMDVHPFLSLGYANWSAGPGLRNLTRIHPGLIYDSLLDPTQRATAFKNGFMLHLLYPTFGVQYIHPSRFGFSAELMYLFDLGDFKGSPYFGLNALYYF
jgi:hypothetical protein